VHAVEVAEVETQRLVDAVLGVQASRPHQKMVRNLRQVDTMVSVPEKSGQRRSYEAAAMAVDSAAEEPALRD